VICLRKARSQPPGINVLHARQRPSRVGEFVKGQTEQHEQMVDIDPVKEKTRAEQVGPKRSSLSNAG
jgi:hypothetical protein